MFHIVGCLRWSLPSVKFDAELYNQRESLRKEKMKTSFMKDLLGDLVTTLKTVLFRF